jgi:uncharacterized MnhB-related membrane protein
MTFFLLILGLLMITAAIAAIHVNNIVSAIIIAGVVSLIGSILFLFAGAPDVAMTEAAIGSALTTVIFLFAWSRIRDLDTKKSDSDHDYRGE